MSRTSLLAGALALVSLPQAAIAQVQSAAPAKPCVSEQEVSALLIYAAPSLIQGVSLRCEKTLSSSGFLATQGPTLAGKFAKRQVEVWPTAKSAMLKLMDKAEEARLVRKLPDEAVHPLFGPVVTQMLIKNLKPADCGKVERGISLLAPLPVESIGALAGYIVAFKNDEKGPKVCPYEEPPLSRKSSG
jgi:hypothetical protein